MEKLNFAKAYVREIGKENGVLIGAIGSTAAVDRYGEIIDQDSWDLKAFKRNPVMLWAHNLTMGEDRPPIGKLTKIKVVDGKLTFNAQFDMEDPFAAEIFRKYKDGFLNAFSVGFQPHTIQRYTEDGKLLDNPILRDNELFEMSAVPVPANPEALNALRSRSFKTKSWEKLMKEVDADEKGDDDEETPEGSEEKPNDPPVEPKKEPTSEETAEEENLDAIASKVAVKVLPQLTKAITDVVIPAIKPKEDVSGLGSSPKKPQQGGSDIVRIMRAATKMLQDGLAEHNRNRQ